MRKIKKIEKEYRDIFKLIDEDVVEFIEKNKDKLKSLVAKNEIEVLILEHAACDILLRKKHRVLCVLSDSLQNKTIRLVFLKIVLNFHQIQKKMRSYITDIEASIYESLSMYIFSKYRKFFTAAQKVEWEKKI